MHSDGRCWWSTGRAGRSCTRPRYLASRGKHATQAATAGRAADGPAAALLARLGAVPAGPAADAGASADPGARLGAAATGLDTGTTAGGSGLARGSLDRGATCGARCRGRACRRRPRGTLGKLVIPGVALLWLAIDSMESPKSMVRAAVAALVLLAVLAALTWFVVYHELGARLVGRAMDAVAPLLRRRRPQGPGYTARALEFRRDTAALVAKVWPRLTVGKVGYAACQALLLWLCLTWLGGDVAPSVAFAAFAAERVLSLAVITPGATGVVEIGMVGMLVAFGTDPATAAAAVLLYRAFIIGMEIPTGGVLMFWWLLRHRDRRAHASR